MPISSICPQLRLLRLEITEQFGLATLLAPFHAQHSWTKIRIKLLISPFGRIWNAETEQLVALLRGHTGEILSAVFSADGRLVVTASLEGSARVWDIVTARSLAEYSGKGLIVNYASLSPDNQFVVIANSPFPVLVYTCDVCLSMSNLIALAHTRVTRALSCEERQTFLHESIACPALFSTPTPTKR